MNTVLCVTDDSLTRSAIVKILGAIDMECLISSSADEVIPYLSNPEINIVILDAVSGSDRIAEICREVRNISGLPVMAVVRTGQEDELAGLIGAGASDFVMSPIRAEELILRLQVLILRSNQQFQPTAGEKLGCGKLLLDHKEHRVWKNDRQINISPMGFALLAYFLAHQSQVVTKRQLMQEVWGYSTPNENANLVEIGIARLRRELGEDPKHPVYLHTIWGKGYRFEYCAPNI